MTFNPRNILIIDFGQLGDVVMSLPALRAIRDQFPHARLTIAVSVLASSHISGAQARGAEMTGWKPVLHCPAASPLLLKLTPIG